jgi:hypothetical protein
MANGNTSNALIPGSVIEEIAVMLNQISTTLAPYVITLTNKERRGIPKMSDKSQPFVKKAVDYTNRNPEFIPSFLKAGELSNNLENNMALATLFNISEQISNNLNDTMMVCGSEALKGSLMYYHNVKQGARNGISNARGIYEDLQKRFPGKTKKEEPVLIEE